MKKLLLAAFIFSICLYILSILFSIHTMGSGKMIPNIYPTQRFIVSNYIYSVPNPARGELILYRDFYTRNLERVGRVVVLPGESVRIFKGHIYVKKDGVIHRLEEYYLGPYNESSLSNNYSSNVWYTLDQDEYLILIDSRKGNPIDIENSKVHRINIKGVVTHIL